MIPAEKLTADKVKTFFFAGKAVFTLRNSNTGNRFTYKVTAPKKQKDPKNPVYFVKVMNGSDNESSYAFAGTIFDKNSYTHSKKSMINSDATSVKVIESFVGFLTKDKVPNGVEVWHEGKCGRCGRRLTVPDSIYTGIGPECAKQIVKEQLDMLELANGKGMEIVSNKAA